MVFTSASEKLAVTTPLSKKEERRDIEYNSGAEIENKLKFKVTRTLIKPCSLQEVLLISTVRGLKYF